MLSNTLKTSEYRHRLLPVRVRPYQGESLRGYVFRVSEENSYPFPSWLYTLEPALRRPFERSSAVEALTRLVGLSPEDQSLLNAPLGEEKFPNQYLSATPRVCPDCLCESGYLRSVWEVSYSCVCPQHGTWLVDKCPDCGSNLSWERHSLLHCDCGASLAGIQGIKADKKSLQLNNLIWKAAGTDMPEKDVGEVPGELLSGASVEQLCSMFRFFSACSLGSRSLLTVKPKTVHETADAMRAAHGYLQNWPAEFNAFLGKTCRDKEGLTKSFGNLYRHLFFSEAGGLGFVQEAFENYVNTTWKGLLRSKQLNLPLGQSSKYISTTDAAKILGVGRRFLSNLVDKSLMEAEQIQRPSGRTLTIISDSDAQRLREEMLYWINGTETRKILGISKSHLNHCLNGKFIQPIAQPESAGFNQWIFDLREIKKWLKKFQKISPTKEPSNGSVSFSVVCKNHLPSLDDIPALLRAVLDGQLQIVGVNSRTDFSLSALFFDLNDIKSFREKLLNKGREKHYTIPELAIRLGVKQDVAYHLINKGIISCLPADKKKFVGRLVPEDSVKRFESEYVKLANIAEARGEARRGAHLSTLQQELHQAGVNPVIGPTVDGCRQYFYLHAELDKINASLERCPSNPQFPEPVKAVRMENILFTKKAS